MPLMLLVTLALLAQELAPGMPMRAPLTELNVTLPHNPWWERYACKAEPAGDILGGFIVRCEVGLWRNARTGKRGEKEGKIFFAGPIPLARPASRKEAIEKMNVWLEKRLPSILEAARQWKEEFGNRESF